MFAVPEGRLRTLWIRNVNYLLGIFRRLYLGLKVSILLKDLDEGEECLGRAILRGGAPDTIQNLSLLIRTVEYCFCQ